MLLLLRYGLQSVPVRMAASAHLSPVACTSLAVLRFSLVFRKIEGRLTGDLVCFRRRKSWQLLTMMQISISILFGFGIVGLIIIYCKICRRYVTFSSLLSWQDKTSRTQRDLIIILATVILFVRRQTPTGKFNSVITRDKYTFLSRF